MSINLAAAIEAVADQPAAELALGQLVRAYALAKCDQTDLRRRKWIESFGHESAWSITSEKLELAAQAMLEHGYKPATANRDLSSLGSVYRWARLERLTPLGFKSPTLGVRRFEEPIRRVHVEAEDLEALRQRALAVRDRTGRRPTPHSVAEPIRSRRGPPRLATVNRP